MWGLYFFSYNISGGFVIPLNNLLHDEIERVLQMTSIRENEKLRGCCLISSRRFFGTWMLMFFCCCSLFELNEI